MSDDFFQKLFGDSEPTHMGSGWISGTASVFFGMLSLGGVLTLHFPALLTLPEAREFYPIEIIACLFRERSPLLSCSAPSPRSCVNARSSA